jgi:FkbM family methyltransferase
VVVALLPPHLPKPIEQNERHGVGGADSRNAMSEILEWAMAQCARPIRGVLHIGANVGQEASYYSKLGLKVVWIEADPHLFQVLKANIVHFNNQTAYLCLASDIDGREVDFHIASNDGGSSSILKFDENRFSKEWPTITEVKSVRIHTCRLDSLLKQQGCSMDDLNLVVADVQGYELPVLRGLGSLINRFEAIISELNWAPVYEDATKPYELESFLVDQGFRRIWLGISNVQATGIWVRGNAGPLNRFYMALSVRLYFVAARFGLVKFLQVSGILGLCRRAYCAAKKRPG